MRFKDYIIETVVYKKNYDDTNINVLDKEIVDSIKKDCKPYLSIIKNTKCVLTRNHMSARDSFIRYKTYSNRKPQDTSLDVSDEVDELLKKKFGWKPRSENVLFCWRKTKEYAVKRYDSIGVEKVVFPIGNFRYVYSPKVGDLTMNLEDSGDMTEIDYFKKHYVDTYTDKDLKGYLNDTGKNVEIMINCKEFYMLDISNFTKEIQQQLSI